MSSKSQKEKTNRSRNSSSSSASAKIVETKEQHVATLQAQATDLEQRLALAATSESNLNAPPPNANQGHHNRHASNAVSINQYRMRLCETLADWLLTDPATAAPADVVGRLWRHCFYARIGPARARLAKEKRKGIGGIGGIGSAATNTGAANSVAKQQESLHMFLAEGITLYEYLCDRLQQKLLQVTKRLSGGLDGMDGDEAADGEPSQEQQQHPWLTATLASGDGIVPCLNRLYISWGDLYRYGDYYAKAEWAYTMAARLGPGSGHAYNQLAVVSQIRHGTVATSAAVTVYWYARSLGASSEPFATAVANLQRLWQSNAAWLSSEQQRIAQPSSTTATTVVLAGSASRLFLSQLVHLQYQLLESQSKILPHPVVDGDPTTNAFYDDLRDAGIAFRELLQSSALGDGLLCKLVVIASFTEFYCQRQNDQQSRIRQKLVAARLLTLQLGQRLAERVTLTLQTKLKPGQASLPSVRVLLPLLLLTEYLLTESDTMNGIFAGAINQERLQSSTVAFWTQVAAIFNLLRSLNLTQVSIESATLHLKEYDEFRGFAPFAPFLNDPNVSEAGYLLDDAAAKERFLVEDGKNGPSQDSTRPSQASGATGADESVHVVKLQRLLGLRPKFLNLVSNGARVRENPSNGDLEVIDVHEEADQGMSEDDDQAMDFTGNDENNASTPTTKDVDMNDDTKQDDILVYQQCERGGPALLVPGALLTSRPAESSVQSNHQSAFDLAAPFGSKDTARATVPTQQQANEPTMVAPLSNVPPIGNPQVGFVVLPPPGFASQHQQDDPMAFLLGNMPDLAPDGSHTAPGLYSNLTVTGAALAPSYDPTIGESLHLFGGPTALQTANPFVTESMPSFGIGSSFAFPQSDANFLVNQDTMGLDGTSLLDSSLLSSLLMDDSPQKATSRNPFAT